MLVDTKLLCGFVANQVQYIYIYIYTCMYKIVFYFCQCSHMCVCVYEPTIQLYAF